MKRTSPFDKDIYRLIELIEQYRGQQSFTHQEKEEYGQLVDRITYWNAEILNDLYTESKPESYQSPTFGRK